MVTRGSQTLPGSPHSIPSDAGTRNGLSSKSCRRQCDAAALCLLLLLGPFTTQDHLTAHLPSASISSSLLLSGTRAQQALLMPHNTAADQLFMNCSSQPLVQRAHGTSTKSMHRGSWRWPCPPGRCSIQRYGSSCSCEQTALTQRRPSMLHLPAATSSMMAACGWLPQHAYA